MSWIFIRFVFLSLSFLGAAQADDPTKLLFIGDSHSAGTFGNTLDEELRENYDVVSYGVGGATAGWYEDGTQTPYAGWSRSADRTEIRENKPYTTKLADLLKQREPNAVVIELGTNFVWSYPTTSNSKRIQAADDKVEKQVQDLLNIAKAPGRTCVWVGPPQLGPHYAGKSDSDWRQTITMLDHVRTIEKRVTAQNGCTFIDSYPVTGYPDLGGDGIHYDRAGPEGIKTARSWAQFVKGKIDEALGQKPHAPPVWKLTPPGTDSKNKSYALDAAGLEDRCGWTRTPNYSFEKSSTNSETASSCSGGRAHCRVSWTGASGQKKSGYFFLNFSCRKHAVTSHEYGPESDFSQLDWLTTFKAECDATDSFKTEDMMIAGCEPTGSITPDLGRQQQGASGSGSTSGQAK